MLPKFANPHSLSQDAEVTTRSEIAGHAERTSVVDDGLERDLDDLLRDTWADVLAKTLGPSKVKRRKMAKGHGDEDGQLVFRLVSTMKHPQCISLDPKPPPPPVTREPECEDDEAQAELRGVRARSVAVELNDLGGTAKLARQVNHKPVVVDAKVPLADMPHLLVIEGSRTMKCVKARHANAGETPAASPHELRASCAVLPVKPIPGGREISKKRRPKAAKERPVPAYWRPPSGMRGKCMGYALGYPSNWDPDRLYVRDTMKRGAVGSA